MTESRTALLGLVVNDAERVPCLRHRYRNVRWLESPLQTYEWGVGRFMAGEIVLRSQPGRTPQPISLADVLPSEPEGTIFNASGAPARSRAVIQPLRVGRWLFAVDRDMDLQTLQTLARSLRQEFRPYRPTVRVEIVKRLAEVAKTSGTRVNILAAEGEYLFAYCSEGDMFHCQVEGMTTCELCDLGRRSPQSKTVEAHRRLRAVCIASSPFEIGEPWTGVSRRQVVVVAPGAVVRIMSGT